ncbi:hypothetical protein [Paraglaciecola sp. L3A3]|uniref:hypothetical protein n=1 Tax=Paraglaciecola sp. L3A3 TaxID=2686358 RepID=UPI00131B8431|nr:hypothetical protein [Paraglaciecola sp. L3A3]
MKLNLAHKNILTSACLIAGLALSGSASAGLINDDFSDGLNGWGGDVNYFDGVDEQQAFDVNFSDYANAFSTDANSVTLSTFDATPDEQWGVYLFQEFVVAADSWLLSLNVDYLADDAYATLVDDNGDLLHDFLTQGLSVDISAWLGNSVALEFGVEDFDYVYDDYLTVSDIAISQSTSPVPEPSALVLFSIALIALRQKSKSRKVAS